MQMLQNYEIVGFVGSELLGSYDGSLASCQFDQPTGICVEDNTVYVVNSKMVTVKMVVGINQMAEYLKNLGTLSK